MRQKLTLSEVREIEQLLAAGGSIRRVARQVKVSIATVGLVRLGKHPRQLPPKQRAKRKATAPKPLGPKVRPSVTRETFASAIDPTPAEIAERCAELRRGKVDPLADRYSFPVLSQL